MKISPQRISIKAFRKYGWVIGYPKKNLKGNKKNLWRIVLKETKAVGWRIAYLVVRDKTVGRLEQHPYSYESFEPVSGRSLLFVSTKQDVKEIECFNLNQPIILKKNVWHAIVTLGQESEIKLTENAFVKCVYWKVGVKLPSVEMSRQFTSA